jgi:hypothetical protein
MYSSNPWRGVGDGGHLLADYLPAMPATTSVASVSILCTVQQPNLIKVQRGLVLLAHHNSQVRTIPALCTCCPQVSPAERALLLTSAAAMHAPNMAQQLQQLSTLLTATHISRPPAGTPDADAAAADGLVHVPGPGSAQEKDYVQLEGPADATPAAAAEAVADAVSATDQQAVAAIVAKAIAAALASEGSGAAPDAPNHCNLPSTSSYSTKGQQGEQEGHHHNQQLQDIEQGRYPGSFSMQQLSQEQAPVGCRNEGDHILSGMQQQQQQQQEAHQKGRLLYQGSLKAAAIACGIDAEGPGFNPAGATISSSPTAVIPTAAPLAAATSAATAAAAAGAASMRSGVDGEGIAGGIPGVFLSDAEVEEYLQVEKARLLTRCEVRRMAGMGSLCSLFYWLQ